jgi:2-acylglycerol O-acyltransferase 2
MDGMIPKTFPEISPIRVLAASILFRIPFVREVALWTSCVSASRASAELCLKEKLSILVIPGGEREQLATEYQRDKVFLKKRLGFIRLALKYQVPIIPTYVFGCVDLYKTSSFAFRFREWLVENLGICIPIFWGEYGTIQPFLVPQTIVFGNPLFLKSLDTDEPSKEQVQQGLELYIEALKALFEENKHEYGYGDRELVIE